MESGRGIPCDRVHAARLRRSPPPARQLRLHPGRRPPAHAGRGRRHPGAAGPRGASARRPDPDGERRLARGPGLVRPGPALPVGLQPGPGRRVLRARGPGLAGVRHGVVGHRARLLRGREQRLGVPGGGGLGPRRRGRGHAPRAWGHGPRAGTRRGRRDADAGLDPRRPRPARRGLCGGDGRGGRDLPGRRRRAGPARRVAHAAPALGVLDLGRSPARARAGDRGATRGGDRPRPGAPRGAPPLHPHRRGLLGPLPRGRVGGRSRAADAGQRAPDPHALAHLRQRGALRGRRRGQRGGERAGRRVLRGVRAAELLPQLLRPQPALRRLRGDDGRTGRAGHGVRPAHGGRAAGGAPPGLRALHRRALRHPHPRPHALRSLGGAARRGRARGVAPLLTGVPPVRARRRAREPRAHPGGAGRARRLRHGACGGSRGLEDQLQPRRRRPRTRARRRRGRDPLARGGRRRSARAARGRHPRGARARLHRAAGVVVAGAPRHRRDPGRDGRRGRGRVHLPARPCEAAGQRLEPRGPAAGALPPGA